VDGVARGMNHASPHVKTQARARWITTGWQVVTMPEHGQVLLRESPCNSRQVEIDLGRASAGPGRYLVLPKAALRGVSRYVPQPYPCWYYHPPTMQSCLVTSAEDALAKGIDAQWTKHPADYGVETHPARPSVASADGVSLALNDWAGHTITHCQRFSHFQKVGGDWGKSSPDGYEYFDTVVLTFEDGSTGTLTVRKGPEEVYENGRASYRWLLEETMPPPTLQRHLKARRTAVQEQAALEQAAGDTLVLLRKRAQPAVGEGVMPNARFASREA